MPVTIDRKYVEEFIKATLPFFDEILRGIEKHDGWIRIAEPIFEMLGKMNVANWPEAYLLDATKWRNFHLNAMIPPEEQQEVFGPYKAADELGRKAFEEALLEDMTEAVKADLNWVTEEWLEEGKEEFEQLDERARAVTVARVQRFIASVITSFLNYLSLMVHGYRLGTLVKKAMEGSDQAYYMAIQIDRTLVTRLPYFAERYWRAAVMGDANFMEFLSYRLKNPPVRGKNQYRTLWLLFAMLDEFELLNRKMTNGQILDIYRSIPQDHVLKPIDDEDYVRKQRARYLRLKRQPKLF